MYAPINASANGANTVIAGTPGQTIRVIAYVLSAAAPVSVTWLSGLTALTGPMYMIAGIPLPVDSSGMVVAGRAACFETLNPGDNLVLSLSSGVQVGGHIEYDRRTV